MRKTSLMLKISIAILLFTLLVLRCGYDRSPEPVSTPGYISYTLRWDSVITGQPAPDKIRYCIYPSGGGAMIQTDGDARGIKLCLPPDKYKILVFNYDVKEIDFRNMGRFEEAEAYLLSRDSDKSGFNGMTPLYRAVVRSLIIKPGMDSTQVLIPTPIDQHFLLAGRSAMGVSALKLSALDVTPGLDEFLDVVRKE